MTKPKCSHNANWYVVFCVLFNITQFSRFQVHVHIKQLCKCLEVPTVWIIQNMCPPFYVCTFLHDYSFLLCYDKYLWIWVCIQENLRTPVCITWRNTIVLKLIPIIHGNHTSRHLLTYHSIKLPLLLRVFYDEQVFANFIPIWSSS